jgi:hypothetical protein
MLLKKDFTLVQLVSVLLAKQKPEKTVSGSNLGNS